MSDVIREYLVALGFKIDETSYKRFVGGLATAGRTAASVGATMVETTAALEVAITRVARHYEELYYVSQRTGTAVSGLKAYGFAATQIGLSFEQAIGTAEAFAATIRTNPGLAGLLRGMGIDTRDARKAQGEFIDRLRALGDRGYFIGTQMAQMYGIGEREFFQMWKNRDQMKTWEEDQLRRQRQAGFNADDAAKKFTTFGRAVNLLEDDISILGDKIAADWIEPATTLITKMDDLVQWVQRANVASNGWLGTVLAVGVALKGITLASSLLGRIFGTGTAAASITGAVGAAGGKSLSMLRLGTVLPLGAGAFTAIDAFREIEAKRTAEMGLTGEVDREAIEKMPWYRRWAIGIQENLFGADARQWARKGGSPAGGGGRRGRGAGGGGGSAQERAIAYFMSQGWSREQAAGIAANISKESRYNPRSVGDGGLAIGLAQWHPDRQAAFREKFGKDLKDATFEEQLAFIQHELTRGNEQFAGRKLKEATTAGQAGAAMSRFYERPKDAIGQAQERAGLAERILQSVPIGAGQAGAKVEINQTTTVHAYGGKSQEVTKGVVDEMDNVNGRLVRNVQGALR